MQRLNLLCQTVYRGKCGALGPRYEIRNAVRLRLKYVDECAPRTKKLCSRLYGECGGVRKANHCSVNVPIVFHDKVKRDEMEKYLDSSDMTLSI